MRQAFAKSTLGLRDDSADLLCLLDDMKASCGLHLPDRRLQATPWFSRNTPDQNV
jgi:hypothetical protein